MRVGKLGVLRGEQHVAHQGELEAASDREAVDRADDRPGIGLQRGGHVDRFGILIGAEGKAGLARFFQVDARREGTAGASEHDGADARIVLQFGEHADDLGAQGPVQRIQCVRPVQRDEGNGAVALDEDDLFGHGGFSLGCLCNATAATGPAPSLTLGRP